MAKITLNGTNLLLYTGDKKMDLYSRGYQRLLDVVHLIGGCGKKNRSIRHERQTFEKNKPIIRNVYFTPIISVLTNKGRELLV